MPVLDLDFVRAQFPAFDHPDLQGQVFFENAGGSYTCKPVIDRLTRFYHSRKVQPYGAYKASRLAGEEMDEARSRLSAMMGVEVDELSFGPSTTANTYVLARAFGEWLAPGDAIIVTDQDHEANSGPWRRLAARGVEVREWKIDPQSGHLDTAALWNMLDDKVKLVCFPHCSNVVGEINPVADICARLRDAGVYSCVDGVSYAPHGLPDVAQLGILPNQARRCARVAGCGAAGGGYISVLGLQDLRPASGADGNPTRIGRDSAQSGALFQRRYALQALHPGGPGSCADCGLCRNGRLY
jgi:selenocysteine lyase/cysteine desulfurase